MARPDGTKVMCGECGYVITLPVKLQDVELADSGGFNLAVNCPQCREVFDAAPGQSVTLNTGPDGLLRVTARVARNLVTRDRDDLLRLRTELERVRTQRDAATATAMLADVGAAAPGLPAAETRLWNLLAVVIALLGVLIAWKAAHPQTPHDLSPGEVQQIITQVIDQVEQHQSPPVEQEQHRHPRHHKPGKT